MKLASMFTKAGAGVFALALCAQAQVALYNHYGSNASDQLGWSVATIGDADADGVEDYAVGAPFWGAVNTYRPGMVRLFSGKTGALLRTWYGSAHGDEFGLSVAPAGDFDHDGRQDVLVGSPGWNSDRGRAVILASGDGAQLWQANGQAQGDYFGTAVARIGYCNADFAQDFAIGAPNEDYGGAVNSGAVRLYSGANGSLMRTYTAGPASYVYFGRSIAGGFNWDGDGSHDLVVGSPLVTINNQVWTGMATIHSGGTGAYLAGWYGQAAGEQLGHSVAGLGDVNGDGFQEVLIGAPFSDVAGTDSGRVEIRSASQTAALRTHTGTTGEKMGYAVASVADADYDARPDYAVGSPDFAYSSFERGIVRVFSGAAGGSFGSMTGSIGSSFGRAVSSAGDLNGDGFEDLIVGASTDSVGGTNAGLARVILWNHSVPTTYGQAKINSEGCTPAVSWSGTPSLSLADDFHVKAANLLNNRAGMFFWGFTSANVPFGGGTRLVGLPLVRTTGQSTGGSATGSDCSGKLDFHFSQAYMQQMGVVAGATIYGQFYHRDPGFAAPNNLALSNAIEFRAIP